MFTLLISPEFLRRIPKKAILDTLSSGIYGCPCQLLGDTLFSKLCYLLVNFFILMEMREGIERGRECEDAGLAEARLALKEDVLSNPISFKCYL